MLGVLDVGGGMRGAYGAGVLDYCIDNHIEFDYAIGVSAGSANIASYLGHQKGRNLPFYAEYPLRKEYMSINNFRKCGSYLDLNYVYTELSNTGKENPLNYQGIMDNNCIFKVVATNALNGEPNYFTKYDLQLDNYDIFKASSCIPLACRPYYIGGIPYYDGGVADPVPILKAFSDGVDNLIVILTKPKYYTKNPEDDLRPVRFLKVRHPNVAEKLKHRALNYNIGVATAIAYEKTGRVKVIAPNDTCGVDTLTKDPEKVKTLYQAGYHDGEQIKTYLETLKSKIDDPNLVK